MRRSVDFPHPEGPTSTQNSASPTSISTPCITSVEPKCLRTSLSVTAANLWRVRKPRAEVVQPLVHPAVALGHRPRRERCHVGSRYAFVLNLSQQLHELQSCCR